MRKYPTVTMKKGRGQKFLSSCQTVSLPTAKPPPPQDTEDTKVSELKVKKGDKLLVGNDLVAHISREDANLEVSPTLGKEVDNGLDPLNYIFHLNRALPVTRH